ncbi:hypothetical protein [Mycoplasma sp. 3398]
MAIRSKIDFLSDQVIDSKLFSGKYKDIINDINDKIKSKEIEGYKNFGFFEIDRNIQRSDYSKIKKIVKFFNDEKIQTFVVIAPQHICIQSKSIIGLANSRLRNNCGIEIMYVDESYEGIDILNLIQYLENRSFAINVISKNGEDIESLIVFRELVTLLNIQVGRNNATNYIFITTNNNYGKLFNLVQTKNYNHLVLLDNTPERYLNYSAAVLLPLACANIDIDDYIEGAKEANEYFSNTNLENNSAYRYALVRYIFNKQDRNHEEKDIFAIENIVSGSKIYKCLNDLFAMYLVSSSYRSYKGIQVNTFIHPSDTKTFANLFYNKQRRMFNTHILVQNPMFDFNIAIVNDNDGDELNFLMKKTFNNVNKALLQATKYYYLGIQIPFIDIVISDLEDKTLGWIVSFIHRASIMSAHLMKIDPFEETGLKTFNIVMAKKINELMGGQKND